MAIQAESLKLIIHSLKFEKIFGPIIENIKGENNCYLSNPFKFLRIYISVFFIILFRESLIIQSISFLLSFLIVN